MACLDAIFFRCCRGGFCSYSPGASKAIRDYEDHLAVKKEPTNINIVIQNQNGDCMGDTSNKSAGKEPGYSNCLDSLVELNERNKDNYTHLRHPHSDFTVSAVVPVTITDNRGISHIVPAMSLHGLQAQSGHSTARSSGREPPSGGRREVVAFFSEKTDNIATTPSASRRRHGSPVPAICLNGVQGQSGPISARSSGKASPRRSSETTGSGRRKSHAEVVAFLSETSNNIATTSVASYHRQTAGHGDSHLSHTKPTNTPLYIV